MPSGVLVSVQLRSYMYLDHLSCIDKRTHVINHFSQLWFAVVHENRSSVSDGGSCRICTKVDS